jgi:hypothetical protein
MSDKNAPEMHSQTYGTATLVVVTIASTFGLVLSSVLVERSKASTPSPNAEHLGFWGVGVFLITLVMTLILIYMRYSRHKKTYTVNYHVSKQNHSSSGKPSADPNFNRNPHTEQYSHGGDEPDLFS